jgi:hypothetical protein
MAWTLTPTRKYLLILGLCLCAAPLIGLVNLVFLARCGEFETVDHIVKEQQGRDALYYSAIRTVTYPYKLSLFHQIKPDIVVLGSSRVFQFRSPAFSRTFVNMGGAMGSFENGAALMKEMALSHKPDVVIMGLDPWFFLSTAAQFHIGNQAATGQEFQVDMMFLPCDWLLRGKVSPRDYFGVLLGRRPSPVPALGVYAVTRMDGYYKDGSFYNLGTITGFHSFADRKFLNVVNKVNNGMEAFKYEKSVDPKRWQEFAAMVAVARQHNIRLITFLTPLPARILDLMAGLGDKYAYIDELRARLPEMSEHHYDFLDPRTFGSSDCEFIDGEHGGEITYLRMLLAISQDPASGLAPYLDLPKIVRDIDQYHGRAMVPPPFYQAPFTETDFLGLGCAKH